MRMLEMWLHVVQCMVEHCLNNPSLRQTDFPCMEISWLNDSGSVDKFAQAVFISGIIFINYYTRT